MKKMRHKAKGVYIEKTVHGALCTVCRTYASLHVGCVYYSSNRVSTSRLPKRCCILTTTMIPFNHPFNLSQRMKEQKVALSRRAEQERKQHVLDASERRRQIMLLKREAQRSTNQITKLTRKAEVSERLLVQRAQQVRSEEESREESRERSYDV